MGAGRAIFGHEARGFNHVVFEPGPALRIQAQLFVALNQGGGVALKALAAFFGFTQRGVELAVKT